MPSSARKSLFSKNQLLIIVLVLAVAGIFFVIFTSAATPSVGVEAEKGTKTGNATINSDTSASAGSYVKFNKPSSPGNPLPFGYGQPNGPSGSFQTKLAFDDEFNGSSLDTAKWNPGWLGSGITPPVQNQELACYDPNQVSVSGGSLILKVAVRNINCNKGSNPHPYASGAVESNGKFRTTYGFFEARVWLDAASNGQVANWPAWWLADSPNYTGEIDIMEGLSGRGTEHVHPGGGGGGCNSGTGWHTLAVDWKAGNTTFYYDGKQCSSLGYSVTSGHMLIIGMQMSPQGQYGGPIKAPTELDIDYVRVWKR